MRFNLLEPTAVSVHELFHVARHAEALGFDGFALNDGTFQMAEATGTYPYSHDGHRNWDVRAPFYEPLTVLPALGLITDRLRIFTSVLKLPLRHPLMLAKQIATAAIMCDDRFSLGVGASWAPEEYEFTGVDWAARGRIMTESLEVLRLVLSGEMVEYHGEIFDFEPLVSRPAPRAKVPLLVGGHGAPSLRRAASLADGWIGSYWAQPEELSEMIATLRRLCEERGRDWSTFEIHALPGGAATLDDYRRLDDLGVTDAMVMPHNAGGELVMSTSTRQRLVGGEVTGSRNPDAYYDRAAPDEKLVAMERFADTVMRHWR
ncbi:TIGR03619 family F420-dependent LLM class oxidoreductase [Ilumatobacter nonamiensis]|uniref:TIGR03619 family F420-dependent LLM class oxidoreductase n=1 Tax=Ilumatobacter nonamiensis TaxID=467093 RepID=UPI00034B857C|nr:TIGR03619 family F420-dependent LLM class oxidoreductase [Ilumatobacter nonamiensis]